MDLKSHLNIKNILKLILGVVIFIYIILKIDTGEISSIFRLNIYYPFLLISFILVLVSNFLNSWRWQITFPELNLKFHKFLYYNLIGSTLSFILPSSFSGDIGKSILFGRKYGNKKDHVVRILFSRILGVFMLCIIGMIGIFFIKSEIKYLLEQMYFDYLTLIKIILIIAFTIVVIYFFKEKIKIKDSIKKLLKILKNKNILFKLILSTFSIHIINFLYFYFLYKSLSIEISFVYIAIIYSIGTVLQIIPINFAGIGVRDLVNINLVERLANVSNTEFISVLFLSNGFLVIISCVTIIWYLYRRKLSSRNR